MEPVLEPRYWAQRLHQARNGQLHHAVFRCPKTVWDRIAQRHRELLESYVAADCSVLDVGCGWGRLLSLVPGSWRGVYVGIDICEEFLQLARAEHPDRTFLRMDIRGLHKLEATFDLAVLISIRPMMLRNCGAEAWASMESQLRRVARNLLFLEYDEADLGSLE